MTLDVHQRPAPARRALVDLERFPEEESASDSGHFLAGASQSNGIRAGLGAGVHGWFRSNSRDTHAFDDGKAWRKDIWNCRQWFNGFLRGDM